MNQENQNKKSSTDGQAEEPTNEQLKEMVFELVSYVAFQQAAANLYCLTAAAHCVLLAVNYIFIWGLTSHAFAWLFSSGVWACSAAWYFSLLVRSRRQKKAAIDKLNSIKTGKHGDV